jgi:dienelactone hydrolase
MQSIAELGFIVVQIDGMGTSNRSTAFHDMAWRNLGDAGFPDRILWHKAVAAKYPYYDVSRVGIHGTSAGGQNAMGALRPSGTCGRFRRRRMTARGSCHPEPSGEGSLASR